MLPIGLIFAFIGRQLGRVLQLAFNWATLVLFGNVPEDRRLFLSAMAFASVVWPILVAGVFVPSFATFLLSFVTVPDWLDPWVRLGMLVLALMLPLVVGVLETRLPAEGARPRGTRLLRRVLGGYPTSLVLFVVLVWMMVVAPIGKIRAILRRRESVHVPIAVRPGRYDVVVRDLAAALARAGIDVSRRRAPWPYEVPAKVIARFGGGGVGALVPRALWQLVGVDFEMTLHPMDLALLGRKGPLARARAAIVRELTFTEAYQTWSREAQRLEERLERAARGEDDLDAIGAVLERTALDFEEWIILYRLFLQVRLRTSPVESDATVADAEPAPPLRERVATAVKVLAGQANGR